MTTAWVWAALAYTLIAGLAIGSVVTARWLHRRRRAAEAAAHAHFLSVSADYRREIDQLRAGATR